MEITSKSVADLRSETGVGMMDCKKALVEAGGDFEEARKILRKRGLATAAHKAFAETRSGSAEALAKLPAPGKPTETVSDAVTHLVAKLGENIGIRRFA